MKYRKSFARLEDARAFRSKALDQRSAGKLAESIELTDLEFIIERNALTNRFLGITGAQFVERFRSGSYDVIRNRPDAFNAVMAWFPELDDEGF